MAEQVFTWVTEVPAGRADDVRLLLSQIDPTDPESALPLASLPALHFGNVVLFEHAGRPGPSPPDPTRPWTMVFEHNIEGAYDDYARQFVRSCRAGLNRIYAHCPGFPTAGADEQVLEYLARHRKRPQLFHVGHPGRPVTSIRADFELRRSIAEELASNHDLRNHSPLDILRALRRTAHCPGGLEALWPEWQPYHPAWTGDPSRAAPATPLSEIRWRAGKVSMTRLVRGLLLMAAAILVASSVMVLFRPIVPAEVIAAAQFAIVFAGIHFTSLDARLARSLLVALMSLVSLPLAAYAVSSLPPRAAVIAALTFVVPSFLLVFAHVVVFARLKPTERMPALDPAAVRELLEAEDVEKHGIYNHVAGLSVFRGKWRWLRRLRTWAALRFLNLFYRTRFVKGKLVTIPSIHFASWTLLRADDHDHVLFVTNYEGAADRYLDDFFESLATGVAFIWHDTEKFPRTTDPRRLKAWVRDSQTLASLRYRAAAYDHLTVAAINNNTFIRRRLVNGRTQATARRFLRRFITALPDDPNLLGDLDRWLRRLAATP